MLECEGGFLINLLSFLYNDPDYLKLLF
jgi:hypothetical protein